MSLGMDDTLVVRINISFVHTFFEKRCRPVRKAIANIFKTSIELKNANSLIKSSLITAIFVRQ